MAAKSGAIASVMIKPVFEGAATETCLNQPKTSCLVMPKGTALLPFVNGALVQC